VSVERWATISPSTSSGNSFNATPEEEDKEEEEEEEEEDAIRRQQ